MNPKDFMLIVVPIKKRHLNPNKGSMVDGEDRKRTITTSISTQGKSLTPKPTLKQSLIAILTPIKLGQVRNPPPKAFIKSPIAFEKGDVELASIQPIEGKGQSFEVVISKLITSEEEVFQDIADGWATQENQGVAIVYSKEKMSALLADIDRLVDKEKKSEQSSDEDCREVKCEVLEMGAAIEKSYKPSRKANESPGVGFHSISDSQPTPSRSHPKKSETDQLGFDSNYSKGEISQGTKVWGMD